MDKKRKPKKSKSNSIALLCHKVHEARSTHWISLNKMVLHKLPADIYKLNSLKHLYINNCRLTGELPIELGELKHLQSIDASCNKINVIPDNLFANLGRLEVLDLRKNLLTSIPYSIGDLLNLREIRMAQNQLVALPHTFAYLRCLKILDVSFNLIRRIQGEVFVGKMADVLEALLLSNNQMDLLPREIGHLTSLLELDLSNNQLYFLPRPAENLKKLQIFRHHGNKWSITEEEFRELEVNSAHSYGGNARKKLKMFINLNA